MKKAYSYIRMSTERQLKGDSLRRQLEASKLYANNNHLELVESIDGIALKDIGMSAFKGKNTLNGVLAVFLDALERGEIERDSVLIIESLDRLSRDRLSQAFTQFMNILGKGIEIVTLTDNQKYTQHIIDSNPTALIIGLSIMFRANEESEIKSKRLSASWSNKRTNIQNKILTKTCPAWLEYDEESKNFKIVPERGQIVKNIFDMCINTCGIYTIAKHLNETKTPQFGDGRIWYVSYVKKILENRSVIGELTLHHYKDGVRTKVGDPINEYYPKVINEETFLLAQVAISKRSVLGKGRKGINFTNIFTGLLHCGLCGYKIMLKNHSSTSQSGKYLICSNKNVSAGCQLPSWNLLEFEGMIFKHFREINFLELIDTSTNENKMSLSDQMSAVILNKANKEEELNRVIDLSTEKKLNDLVKERYVTKANLLSQEISQLELKVLGFQKLIIEHSATENLFNTENIKQLICKIEEHHDDYLFRSSLNQLLNKLITKIELLYDPHHINPWEFGIDSNSNDIDETNPEEDSVLIAFRSTFKIRAKLSMAEIINHPDFELFNRNYNRFIRITYKTGIVRELYAGSDSSFAHKPFNASNKKLS